MKVGGPGWICASNLPVQSRTLCSFSCRAAEKSGYRCCPDLVSLTRRVHELLCQAGMKLAEAGGHAPHAPGAHDLISKQSRRAGPVQLPMKLVGCHGAAPCSAD